MRSVLAQGSGTIAHRNEDSHQPRYSRRACRLEAGEAFPPRQSKVEIVALFCRTREPLERCDVHIVKAATMPSRPSLEIVRIPEKAAIQERTLTQRRCALERRRGDCALEFVDVARYDRWIQAELRPSYDRFERQVTTKRGERLIEGIATVCLVTLGPQQCDNLLATAATLSRRRQEREQREWPSAGRDIDGGATGLDCEPTKGP